MKKSILISSIAVAASVASVNAQTTSTQTQASAQTQTSAQSTSAQTQSSAQLQTTTAQSQVTPVALPQTAPEMFVAMPDSMMPYLAASQRKTLVEIRKMDAEGIASIPGAFNKDIKITSMSDGLIRIVPSDNAVWEIVRCDNAEYAFIRTLQGPAQQSTISIFNNKWNKLRDVKIPTDGLIAKPDTMSQETFDGLCAMIEIPMAYATVDDDCSTVTVSLSLPLVTKEDAERIKAILVQRKIKLHDIFLK